ncbi:MAG: aminoacyl-histidine dipeptidase [Bacteroidales bacterium]
MTQFSALQPQPLWNFFHSILAIPRPSDQEELIRNYLVDFAVERNLGYELDQAGNLMIRKAATPGMEGRQSVCLQSHLDMVCEKNSNIDFDFLQDPIPAYVDQGWVKSRGTTLGADDGIGIATQMAILDSTEVAHGPLECLFTVAEETGLTGAFGLGEGFIHSKILLNLDSEDEGEIFIGCAGGIDMTAWLGFEKQKVPPGSTGFELTVAGLRGGHSGDDIHKGYGNANKIINRFLRAARDHFGIRLHHLEGGNLRNAIAREARAIFTIASGKEEALHHLFIKFSKGLEKEFPVTEPEMALRLNEHPLPDWVIDQAALYRLIHSVYACPHGVYAWSQAMPGLVETSSNLAAIRFQDNEIKITTSQRSSLESAKEDMINTVESVFLLAGARCKRSTGYPGWNPNPASPILEISVDAYRTLFGIEPHVKAIHAGLECGLFLEKYPDLDMISFGPTIKGAHSPDERLEISTVKKFWDLLTEILKRIPNA